MTLPDPVSPPSEPHAPRQALPPRGRRRRRGQLIIPNDAEGRGALLTSLSRRAYPSYELFVYAILCGAILGLGFVIDSQALLLFGVLVAPLLTPWIGLLLATITGSLRFLFETFMALLITAVLIFLIGILAGFAVRPFLPRTLNDAFLHSRLWWPDLIILTIGAVVLTLSFVRSEERPFLPSVILAYELFLPLSAGGFGLGSGIGGIWPQGVLVFLVHFAWASLFGLITLFVLRFMPTNLEGFFFSGGLTLILVVILALLMSGGSWTPSFPAPQAADVTPLPISSPMGTPTTKPLPVLPANPRPGASSTPLIETLTPTLPPSLTSLPITFEITLPPTETPTVTLTIEPTPVYARVHAEKGGGAILRQVPGGKGIAVLDNFSIVQVLPDTQEVSGYSWTHVIATVNGNRLEGWILQLVLEVATPVPNWQPSATPAFTPTP